MSAMAAMYICVGCMHLTLKGKGFKLAGLMWILGGIIHLGILR